MVSACREPSNMPGQAHQQQQHPFYVDSSRSLASTCDGMEVVHIPTDGNCLFVIMSIIHKGAPADALGATYYIVYKAATWNTFSGDMAERESMQSPIKGCQAPLPYKTA